MEQEVHIDFETRSATDLRKSGVYRYTEDPRTQPWGFAYRFGTKGQVLRWVAGSPGPQDLLEHIKRGGRVVAHNAVFERVIWNEVLIERMGLDWPKMTIAQQDCTMSRAAAIAHPQGLDQLGKALKSDMRKDVEGHKLMMKMARVRRYNADGTVTWWGGRENIDRLMDYCEQDVRTETAIGLKLPPLSDDWRKLWEFDQLINERGVPFDMPVVKRAAQLVEYSKKQNDKIMRDLTDRAVPKCSSDRKILAWLNGRGIKCTSLAKGFIDDVKFMAECQGDETALRVLELRQAAWKTSTAKYKAMEACVCQDGNIRGLLNFHGASTGRWAGRLVQPQNFPRTNHEDDVLQGKIGFLHGLLNGKGTVREVYDQVEALYGPLEGLTILSKALRSVIKAQPGKHFIGGDFSNIEGRVNAWLAGEAWKLTAFRAYDDRTGPDLYKLAYARSFGVDVESVGKGRERQIGKVQELALGFQGGINAYLSMGANYGVDPFELSGPVYEATKPDQWDAVAARYHTAGCRHMGLFEKEWTALQVLVDNWRAANPAIVQSWWDYQDAAIEAVAVPGSVVKVALGRVSYYSDGRALWCVLPSGRMLCYSSPEIVEDLVEYTDKHTGELKSRLRRKVKFSGVDSKTRQWKRRSMYGGLQCENIVQATACDLMVDSMFRVEEAGYPVILTVHDEILTQLDKSDTSRNEDEFEKLMALKPDWAQGLPVSVGAWQDERYIK